MIHHVSIPARDPRRVSAVLAELMGGKSYPFPGANQSCGIKRRRSMTLLAG